MITINQAELNPEIISKYVIADNTFAMAKIKNAELDKYDGKPKDEINIEIGDSKVLDTFLPQAKLMRWSNECNFSVRLVDDEVGQESVSTLADKIVWEKGNKKIEFYDYIDGEGGYKLIWYLNKKPKTNKVNFTIQSKSLDFFYQPELTPEEIAQGAFRPENVVGSYAVYHSTKGGMNDINGKDYKTGQAFFIYRPHIIDAEGKETWGILHIENGIYSVEIPQDFLDKAVYPIKSNDTFGYTTAGGTEFSSTNYIDASICPAPSFSGTVTKISLYIRVASGTPKVKAAIYLNSDKSLVSNSATDERTLGIFTDAWTDFTYSGTQPTITGSTVYDPAMWPSTTIYEHYNTVAGYSDLTKSTAYGAWPNPFSGYTTYTNSALSIYATYTAGGGGVAKPHMLSSAGVGS